MVQEPAAPAAGTRKKKHAQTARLMYLGDLQEKDEDEMRKLWSEWKSKEKEDAAGISAVSEEDRLRKPKMKPLTHVSCPWQLWNRVTTLAGFSVTELLRMWS